jgi:hypothetical protein
MVGVALAEREAEKEEVGWKSGELGLEWSIGLFYRVHLLAVPAFKSHALTIAPAVGFLYA